MNAEHSAKEQRRDFLERAAEADSRAETSSDGQLKLAWLGIAASWRQMAKQAGRLKH